MNPVANESAGLRAPRHLHHTSVIFILCQDLSLRRISSFSHPPAQLGDGDAVVQCLASEGSWWVCVYLCKSISFSWLHQLHVLASFQGINARFKGIGELVYSLLSYASARQVGL